MVPSVGFRSATVVIVNPDHSEFRAARLQIRRAYCSKAGPIGLRRRHRRAARGGPTRTDLSGIQSPARHRNGRSSATRARPRLPSRNSSRGLSMSHHDKNNSGFTTTNRSGSLNIIRHVQPLGRSGWYSYYGCASIEDMAEQFSGLTLQGSGSADVDYCSTSCISQTTLTIF